MDDQRPTPGLITVFSAGEPVYQLTTFDRGAIELGRDPTSTLPLSDPGVSRHHARVELSGDNVLESAQEPTPPTLLDRIQRVVGNTWSNTQAPTATHRRNYEIASRQLSEFLPKLKAAADELRKLEEDAEAAGAPWTPGRIPVWKP